MFVIKCSIFYLAVGVMMGEVVCLVELPQVEDNDIKNAELIIRTTTNTLFSTLKLQSKKGRPRLQYFTLVHHYLTSLTLEDYTALREIAKLTRVDKKAINNRTQNFITALTEVLDDERNNLDTENVTKVDGLDAADRFIEEYMKELEHKVYSNHSYDSEIEIVKLLIVQDSNKNSTNEIQRGLDFWKPSPLDLLKTGRRIYRGKDTRIKYYPFMASVHIFDQFVCGGCIIKADLILTAASCVQLAYNNRMYRENPLFLSVRIGSTFYEGTGEKIDVVAVYFYPTYNPRKLHNNLAILRLTRLINFHNKRIKKIEIDREAHPLPVLSSGILVLGWGSRMESNKLLNAALNKLATALLDVYPLTECKEVYSKEYVTQQNFCAGYFSKGGGACNRDVGGPGLVAGILVGIVSFGSPLCGTPDAPTVFTKVGYYSDWIDEIMDQVLPRGKALTTKIPRTISWNLTTLDPDQHFNNLHTLDIYPIMKGNTPLPVITVNPAKTSTTPTKSNQFLRDEYFNAETPSESSEEIQPIVKIQSEAKTGFTVTTYATPLANLELGLPTTISNNVSTPERSDEYSSTENISPTNTGTNDSKTEEDNLSDEGSSMDVELKIAEETYPKDKLYSQMTVAKYTPSQDQKPLYDQNPTHYKKPSQDDKLEIAEETYPKDKLYNQMTVLKDKPSQDQKLLYDQIPLRYELERLPSQDEKLEIAEDTHAKDKLFNKMTVLKDKPSQDQKPLYDQKPLQDEKLEIEEETYPQNKWFNEMTVLKDKPSQDQKPLYDQKPLHYKKPSQDEKSYVLENTSIESELEDKKLSDYKKPSQDEKSYVLEHLSKESELEDKKLSDYKKPSQDEKSYVLEHLSKESELEDKKLSHYKKPSQDEKNFVLEHLSKESELEDKKLSHYKKPSQDEKSFVLEHLSKESELEDKKLSHYKKPAQDEKSYALENFSKESELEDKKPLQDENALQYEKLLRDKKPQNILSQQTSQETLTETSQETLQETSQETSKETSPPKMSASQTSPPQVSPAVMPLTERSPSKMLTTKESTSEIKSRAKLPKIEAANEDDSEEKYLLNEESPDVRNDVSGSESESDSSAIPIEIETAPEIEKSAEELLRVANSAIHPALPQDMLGILSNSPYLPEESSSDSEKVDPELSLAPSLATNINKENQTEIDKTILTLLYLSDNEKNNDINNLLDDTKVSQMNSESESMSGEDVSIKTKPNINLTFRSKNAEKYSKKLTMNNEFSNNILFDILKQAVKNDALTDQLKKINKLKRRRRSNELVS